MFRSRNVHLCVGTRKKNKSLSTQFLNAPWLMKYFMIQITTWSELKFKAQKLFGNRFFTKHVIKIKNTFWLEKPPHAMEIVFMKLNQVSMIYKAKILKPGQNKKGQKILQLHRFFEYFFTAVFWPGFRIFAL